jgi:hypothetical protein
MYPFECSVEAFLAGSLPCKPRPSGRGVSQFLIIIPLQLKMGTANVCKLLPNAGK